MCAELDRVLEGRSPTAADMPHLSYTQNVVWESMRLYPAAWVINRQVIEPVEVGGHMFKPGETIMMSQYVMHRRADYFTNPDSFQPERFAGDLLKRIPQFAFFPFGGGPRVCIGNHFALMEATLLLACMYQKFRFHLAEGHHPIEPEPLVTLRPKNGIHMEITRR